MSLRSKIRSRLLPGILLAASSLLLAGGSGDGSISPEVPGGVRKLVRPAQMPPVTTNNSNATIHRYRRNELNLSSSSTWSGWEPDKAVDDDIQSSWFSARADCAARGQRPWLQVSFSGDETIKRVTVLGNRDPQWLVGYTILAGSLQLYDADGKQLLNLDNTGTGNFRDFDFKLDPPVANVRGVRFTSTYDQGGENPYEDIAIAELQVE